MQTVRTHWGFEHPIDGMEILRRIERAGRTCWKSEGRATGDEATLKFVGMITHQKKHHSVLEHASVGVRVVCDRGISHEIVRHRIAAYSQESTRYCNYGLDKFGREVTFVWPEHMDEKSEDEQKQWREYHEKAEAEYFRRLDTGWTPQEARDGLPHSLKTEIVMTYNMRQWRHFFAERTAKAAHPQLRACTRPMLMVFKANIPVLFDDFPDYEAPFHH